MNQITYIIALDGVAYQRTPGDNARVYRMNTLLYSYGATTQLLTCQSCGRNIPAKQLYGVHNINNQNHCMRCVDTKSR